MKLISFLLSRSRTIVTLATLAGIVSGVCNAALLALINRVLTDAAAPRTLLLYGFVGLCALVPLSRIASELLLNRLGQEAIARLRTELSRRVLAVPLRKLEEIGPHRVLSILAEDVPTITNIVSILPNLCINAAVFGGALAYLAWLSLKIFGAMIVLIILGLISYQIPIIKGMASARRVRDLHDELFHHFRALTEGAKELKVHSGRRRAFLSGKLETTALSYRDENIAGMRVYTIAASWGQLMVFVIIGFLLFIFSGHADRAAGTLTAYTLTLLYLVTPLQVLMNSVPNFTRAQVALRLIDEMELLLVAEATEAVAADEAGLQPSWQSLELAGVTHVYRREGQENEFVLGPIDLTLHPGELLFIAGGNGSGKTTLAKLLVGLYIPRSGEIRVDGRHIDDRNREMYRQRFSVVFSDFFLFDSLIGLGAPDLDAQARRYLERLNLIGKVEIREGRFSSLDLSQGQRKRLALLVAYLEDRPIYLFDEWAADQDPVFKEIFYRDLLPALKASGKAAVVISHDDRYYDVADRIIKLDSGRMVGTGRTAADALRVETAAS